MGNTMKLNTGEEVEVQTSFFPRAALILAMTCGLLPAKDPPVVRVSPGVQDWKLMKWVRPAYPRLAREYRIEGTVRFSAVIGADGRVERLQLVSGHPLLTEAAAKAVRQWVYRETIVGSERAMVITVILVTFRLPAVERDCGERRDPETRRA